MRELWYFRRFLGSKYSYVVKIGKILKKYRYSCNSLLRAPAAPFKVKHFVSSDPAENQDNESSGSDELKRLTMGEEFREYASRKFGTSDTDPTKGPGHTWA